MITVMGQRGAGKSSWVKAFVFSLSRVLIFDPMGEYTDSNLTKIDDLGELFRFLALHKDTFFQVAFSPEKDSLFDTVCRVFPESIQEYESGAALDSVWFVIEEVDIHASPQKISEPLSRLVRRGRHYGVSLLFTTRRPAEMNRILDTQSNRFVCFKMIGANEYNYMRSVIGEAAADLQGLNTLEFIEYDGEIRRGRVVVHPKYRIIYNEKGV